MSFREFLNEGLKNSKLTIDEYDFVLKGVEPYTKQKNIKGKDFESYDIYFNDVKIGNVSNTEASLDTNSKNGKIATTRKTVIRWYIQFEPDFSPTGKRRLDPIEYNSKQTALTANINWLRKFLK